jgi:hypothetical protein
MVLSPAAEQCLDIDIGCNHLKMGCTGYIQPHDGLIEDWHVEDKPESVMLYF